MADNEECLHSTQPIPTKYLITPSIWIGTSNFEYRGNEKASAETYGLWQNKKKKTKKPTSEASLKKVRKELMVTFDNEGNIEEENPQLTNKKSKWTTPHRPDGSPGSKNSSSYFEVAEVSF